MDNKYNTITTSYGKVTVYKAAQDRPYRLYRKIFKSKAHKELINELKGIVRKYYPDYNDTDVEKLYSELSKKGCTYASMANVIIEQLGYDDEIFKEYFGYSLYNSNGKISNDKLMVDIYACISQMVELKVYKYEKREFDSLLSAANGILNKKYTDENEAEIDLFNSGWIRDGFNENHNLVFKTRAPISNETLIGTYREIAKNLFNIDDINVNKEKLENLLKTNNFTYKFDYLAPFSKFSGLSSIKNNNLKKWMNKYFELNNIDLKLDIIDIDRDWTDYNEFQEEVFSKSSEGYSIEVASPIRTETWMTDGKIWLKPTSDKAGHQMNFEGFDKEGNILVCSWGQTHMFPKEYYKNLEFTAIKVLSNDNRIKKGL